MAKSSTSFVKGQSGNMDGRPKKEHSITQTIRDMMDEKPEIKKALGAKILEMAMKGDLTAIKTIWNYLDGMPLQSADITSGGEPLQMITLDTKKDEKKDGK